MRDILAWALATEILGLAVLPWLRAFFGNRRDAALLSRPLGLAVVAWVAWALSLAAPFGFRRFTTVLALGLVAAAAWLARRRSTDETVRASIWGDPEKLGAAMFWGAAAVFLLIRAAGPAIVGQEKFMDLAFLTSLGRFPGMPPADPWMAGRTINYYYWGYLLAATQRKLSDVAPMVAYNLSIASFGASSFVAAACMGLRLSRGRLGVGLGAGGLAVFAGNLSGALDAWANPFGADFDYFKASRVIGPEQFKTINEFPFFTFFHADLHPHLLAFPFFIAAFVMAHRWMESESEAAGVAGWRRWTGLFLVALTAGTARAASLWNMPALAILFAVCGLLLSTGGARWPAPGAAFRGLVVGLSVFFASLLLFYPYTASFALENRGTARTTMFSGVFEFLGVWGILFAVAAVGLWPGAAEDTERARRRRDLGLTLGAGVALLAGFFLRMPAVPIVLALAFLAARAGWRSLHATEGDGDPEGVYAAFLVLLGLGMVAGCEFVYLKDSYGTDLQRMNTIFKFYHQAWPLLAIGAAVFAGRAWAPVGRRRTAARVVLVAAGFLALLWPVNAAVSRLKQRDGAFTLDGRPALARRSPADAAAIDWLTKNAPRGSVVLEASGDPYTEFARISSHTGIPTVLGWANHEGLWRGNEAEIGERLARIRAFYTAGDLRAALETIQKYGITHVVVGDMERRAYPGADNVARFPFLVPVHTGDTAIYAFGRPEK
jgi:YYY domain-containing protein